MYLAIVKSRFCYLVIFIFPIYPVLHHFVELKIIVQGLTISHSHLTTSKGKNIMESLVDFKFVCGNCSTENQRYDDDCYKNIIVCDNCGNRFPNMELNVVSLELAKNCFSGFPFTTDDGRIWFNSKNSAIYLHRCQKTIYHYIHIGKLNGEKKKNGRWSIEGFSLASLGKEYRKLSAGLSAKEAAEKLGISINLVYHRLQLDDEDENKLSGGKISGQWRIIL